MILTVPLQAGTVLANVRYKWIVNGVEGSELSVGITQPSLDFPVFRFDVVPPFDAEELTAYDSTDLSNWNVGGYKLALAAAEEIAEISVSIQKFGTIQARTVTFQSIYEAVLRRLGLDPVGDSITSDTARAITEHITERCRTAWGMWDWPELTRTDERAYRELWNIGVQYRKIGENGLPDELYYIPTSTYFKVKVDAVTDPPIGTVPTDTDYFEPLDPVTHYVARDQGNRRPMGPVLNVYSTNPSLNGCCSTGCLKFRPSEKGITICHGPATTVFVQYWIDTPVFTMVPFISGKTYHRGDRVFYTRDGDCYQCIAVTSSALPTDTNHWVVEPVPEIFAPYIKAGVYADCLKEMPFGADAQAKAIAVAEAKNEAEDFIGHEIDDLLKQGQKHHWMKHCHGSVSWRYDGTLWKATASWCCSEPWTGNIVFGLTDEAVPAESTEECDSSYHPEIVAIKTVDGAPSLEGLDTVSRRVTCTLITFVVVVDGSPEEQGWRLDAGIADVDDAGQLAPTDFDAGNPKHWTKVG